MSQMRVKDLVEILLKVDQELPLHKRGAAGDFAPVDSEYVGYWLNYGELMQSKNDSTYFAMTNDRVWKDHKAEFETPFKAVVIW